MSLRVVWTDKDKVKVNGKLDDGCRYSHSVIRTNSHTTMVNGLSVLGWGIASEKSAMLGQPMSMTVPRGDRFQAVRQAEESITETDLVLTVTEALRKRGVVGGRRSSARVLPIADRATLGNMSPNTARRAGSRRSTRARFNYPGHQPPRELVSLVAAYAKAQGMYRVKTTPDPISRMCSSSIGLGRAFARRPERPQDRVALKDVKAGLATSMDKEYGKSNGFKETRTRSASQGLRSRPWRCRDCGNHLLHQPPRSEA